MLRQCKRCGEEFEFRPGKPGLVNVCLDCDEPDVERVIAISNPHDSTGSVFAVGQVIGGRLWIDRGDRRLSEVAMATVAEGGEVADWQS